MLVTTYTEQVQDLYAAFSQGNVEKMLTRMDDNISWEAPAEGAMPWCGAHIGKTGFMYWLDTFARHLDIQVFEPRDYIEQDGKVVVFVYTEVVLLNNGRKLINPEVHYWTFQGDKLIRFQVFNNTGA